MGGEHQTGSQGAVVGFVQLHVRGAVRLGNLAVFHPVGAGEDGAAHFIFRMADEVQQAVLSTSDASMMSNAMLRRRSMMAS